MYQGDAPFIYFVLLPNVFITGLYWSFGLALVFMEYLNKPKHFFKYKIQQDKSSLDDAEKIRKVINFNFKISASITQLLILFFYSRWSQQF